MMKGSDAMMRREVLEGEERQVKTRLWPCEVL